jgi:hypothetical protein
MRRPVVLCFLAAVACAIALAQDKKVERPTIEQVGAKYMPQIKRLKGVVEVNPGKQAEEELIVVGVETKADKELLDNLLSDTLEGYRVAFEVKGRTEAGDPGEDKAKEENKAAAEKAKPKGTPLCFECTGPKYPEEQGICSRCGGWTKSTAFKYCDDCARALGVCARCGKACKQDE